VSVAAIGKTARQTFPFQSPLYIFREVNAPTVCAPVAVPETRIARKERPPEFRQEGSLIQVNEYSARTVQEIMW
jgi:hypothetical protein